MPRSQDYKLHIVLTKFASSCTLESHWKAVKRILTYLAGSLCLGLTMQQVLAHL